MTLAQFLDELEKTANDQGGTWHLTPEGFMRAFVKWRESGQEFQHDFSITAVARLKGRDYGIAEWKKAAAFLGLPLIVAEALVKADKNDPTCQELRMEIERRVKLEEVTAARQKAQDEHEKVETLAASHKARQTNPEEEHEQWQRYVKG